MKIKDLTGFSPKELAENRYGYDDSGMSLRPGNDEGEDSWDYSAAHDRIGAGDPRRHRGYSSHEVDIPHDVHINGRKWKTFGSKKHAEAVARKLASNGKKVHVQRASEGVAESATVGGTSSANIATVANPKVAYSKKTSQPKKKDGTAVNALDMKGVSLFGGPAVKR